MSCCCTNTYDLGCVPSCGELTTTGINATQSGNHTLEINAKYAVFKMVLPATAGLAFRINLAVFNESEQIVFKIKQPDGTYFEYTDSPDTYDCFTIKTTVEQWYEST